MVKQATIKIEETPSQENLRKQSVTRASTPGNEGIIRNIRKRMKAFSLPSFGLNISLVVRVCAYFDVFRFLVILGPMVALFLACDNLNPTYPPPRSDGKPLDLVLYGVNKINNVTGVEAEMLHNVETYCGKQYKTNLPYIWQDAKPTMMKALYLEGISVVLPVASAILFLMFQKRDLIASLTATLHFIFEIISIVLAIFASWFISDSRLCLLASFHGCFLCHVPTIFWSLTMISTVTYKAAVLYSLDLYIKTHCKNLRTLYTPPTPEEELRAYLKEMRTVGVTPNIRVRIPKDLATRDWHYVNLLIKSILQDVRIQMAELHRDDPLVDDLLRSGKLHGHIKKRASTTSSVSGGTGTGQNVLKIARLMASESTEYKLLKQHQHHHHGRKSDDGSGGQKDEIEIILPEPNLRTDPDPL